jgi:hypothetical protein
MRVCQFRHSGTIVSSVIGWIGSNFSVQKRALMIKPEMSSIRGSRYGLKNPPLQGTARYFARSVPQRLNRLRKNSGAGRKDVPQGLKPDVFSIIYGPTKVVP